MRPDLEVQLQEAGDELLDEHDPAVIADVIGEVQALDDDNSDVTAKILETMVGIQE